MYPILASLLLLTYLVKTRDDRTEQRLAILYFAFVFSLTGFLWKSGFQAKTNEVYFGFMGTASFLLVILYHSLNMTRMLFVASLLEIWQVLVCAAGAFGASWAARYYVDIAMLCNYLALAILVWSWANGNDARGRRVYSRLVHSRYLGLPSLDRFVARHTQKVEVSW
jgi:hypothetical protein